MLLTSLGQQLAKQYVLFELFDQSPPDSMRISVVAPDVLSVRNTIWIHLVICGNQKKKAGKSHIYTNRTIIELHDIPLFHV